MADKFTSPREIAELNIRHYKHLLDTPLDDQTRTIVKRLLAEEEVRLAEFLRLDDRRPPQTGEPADKDDAP
jgi:hypothetical protein